MTKQKGEEHYALFTDDGAGNPARFMGIFDSVELAVASGKELIGTPIIAHFDREFMTVEEVEEILGTFNGRVTCHGDNHEMFHIISTDINQVRPLEEEE